MVGLDVDRVRAGWWAIAAVLFATVVFVVYSFVGTFVFALFIYYATRPVYNRIYQRVPRRNVAAGLALLMFALPAILLLAYTVAIALQEAAKLQSVDAGPLPSFISTYVDVSGMVEHPAGLLQADGSLEAIRQAAVSALGYLGFIGNGLLHLFVMFALSFYLLRDSGRLSRWVVQFGDDRGIFQAYGRAVDASLKQIYFGNILNAIMTGAIGAISFSLLNFVAPPGLAIPYPALTGLLAGVASLVPIVGMKLVYIPVVGYLGFTAAVQGGDYSFVVVVFLVSLVVVDTLPDLVLRPYVSGRNLHVGLVMFAYILGPLLFGWYGIFLGPLLLVLVVHFARIVLPELVTRQRIQPYAIDPGNLSQERSPPPAGDPEVGVSDGGTPGDPASGTGTGTESTPEE